MGIGPQTTVWWPEPAIFSNFGRDIFGKLMQHHEVPHRLSNDPKWLTLHDLEMSFYAKISIHRQSQ